MWVLGYVFDVDLFVVIGCLFWGYLVSLVGWGLCLLVVGVCLTFRVCWLLWV